MCFFDEGKKVSIHFKQILNNPNDNIMNQKKKLFTPVSENLSKKSMLILLLISGLLYLSGSPADLTAQQSTLTPVEYNKEQMVKMAVQGQIGEPSMNYPPYRIGADGSLEVLPGTGSITYNFRTGDSAIDIAGDHVEPAVTLIHPRGRASGESRGLNVLSCIGNEVQVITGQGRGMTGYVIGKHGGAEHVMVDFKEPDALDKLLLGDRMHIYAYGAGMKLTNIEHVKAINMSPKLIKALTEAGMGITSEGKLRIGVALRVPAMIMGSGLGRNHTYSGDYDIQLFDEQVVEKYNLNQLRFGDIVAIINADSSYGRIFKTGAITIGVITHSNSIVAGHGPGVTTLFTSPEGNIEPVIDPDSNLKNLLFR